MNAGIRLKPGRDKSIRNGHPWIFSGGIQSQWGDPSPGDLIAVESSDGRLLGVGFYNPESQIRVRVVPGAGLDSERSFWFARLDRCLSRRASLRKITNSFRIVHGESDGMPGLVIDLYDTVAVVQLSSIGTANRWEIIRDWIVTTLRPSAIVERSESPSLRAEGLRRPAGSIWWGGSPMPLMITEYRRHFWVDTVSGQKTGFFNDQRDNRKRVSELGHGRVLNLFSFSGGFTVAAALNGASTVSVDSSAAAIDGVHQNLHANGVLVDAHQTITADVFDYLRAETDAEYDLVIVDPPALVKRQADVNKGARAYKDVNRLAFQRVTPGGLMLTCSCSQFVDWTLFRQIVFAAAVESGRDVQIVGQFTQPSDHPVNICFPEGEYLKTLLLRVY